MNNPILIPAIFAINGIKNFIQKQRQTGQDLQDFTWNDGAPAITMIKIEDGGKAPKGQDFNGVLSALSEHSVFKQNGGRYKWSQDVIDNFGGYPAEHIVTSNDGKCDYKSLINNNTSNPNTQVPLKDWMIYAGEGSVYPASSTVSGMMKVLNILNSTDIASALSANMGRVIYNQLIGVNQTWKRRTQGIHFNEGFRNNTGKPIQVSVYGSGRLVMNVDGREVSVSGSVNWQDSADRPVACVSAIIPNGSFYRLYPAFYRADSLVWMELTSENIT